MQPSPQTAYLINILNFTRKIEEKKQANFSGDLKYAMYYDFEYFVYNDTLTRQKNNKTNLNDKVFIPNVPLLTVVAQINHNSLLPDKAKVILESKF